MQDSRWLLIGFVALLVVLFVVKRLRQVSSSKAHELLEAGALVLDVRSSDEFATDHIEGSVNLPVEQIGRRIGDIESDHSRPMLVHCLSGSRSAMACRILRGLGYNDVHDLGSLGRARAICRK